MQIYKVQLKKLFLRSDVRICLVIFLAVPLFLAFLISIGSGAIEVSDTAFSAMQYAVVVTGLLKSMFLIGVIILLIGTSLVAREIDTGLDTSYFTRVKDRKSIFVSKTLAMNILVTAVYAALLISSTAAWLIFLRGTSFGDSAFFASNYEDAKRVVLSYLRSYLEIIALSNIFLYISVLCRYNKAIVINILLLVGIKLLSKVPLLQQLMPTYIGDSQELYTLSGTNLVLYGFKGILILLIYAAVFIFAGTWTYKKIDLVR